MARRAVLAVDDADEEAAAAILGPDHLEAAEALRWLTRRQPAAALRLAADLGWQAHRHGTGDWLAPVLEQLCATAPAEAASAKRDALLWPVQLQSWSPGAGDRAVLIAQRLADGLALARRLEEPLQLLGALRVQVLAVAALGDIASAMGACHEVIDTASRLGHARWLGRFEISLGSIHSLLREFDAAGALAASGLARSFRSGDRRGIVLACLVLHGQPDGTTDGGRGLPSLQAVLALVRELGDAENETHVLAMLAHRAVGRADAGDAATWTVARQEHLGRAELLHGLTVSVMLAVHIGVLRGELRTSARLHGAVASHVELLLPQLAPHHVQQYLAAVNATRAGLGPSRFDAEVGQGRLLDRQATLPALMDFLNGVVGAVPRQRGLGASTDPHRSLSPRERQVLDLLAQGLRNKEIALRLQVTPKTVMHHTAAIYRKLGVRGRTQAATSYTRRAVGDVVD